MAVGLLQGLRTCAHYDISQAWFGETILGPYPFHMWSLRERATATAGASAPGVEASIDVWRDTAAEYTDYLQDMGFDRGMYDALHRLFDVASDAGHGGADWESTAEHATTR